MLRSVLSITWKNIKSVQLQLELVHNSQMTFPIQIKLIATGEKGDVPWQGSLLSKSASGLNHNNIPPLCQCCNSPKAWNYNTGLSTGIPVVGESNKGKNNRMKMQHSSQHFTNWS